MGTNLSLLRNWEIVGIWLFSSPPSYLKATESSTESSRNGTGVCQDRQFWLERSKRILQEDCGVPWICDL